MRNSPISNQRLLNQINLKKRVVNMLMLIIRKKLKLQQKHWIKISMEDVILFVVLITNSMFIVDSMINFKLNLNYQTKKFMLLHGDDKCISFFIFFFSI